MHNLIVGNELFEGFADLCDSRCSVTRSLPRNRFAREWNIRRDAFDSSTKFDGKPICLKKCKRTLADRCDSSGTAYARIYSFRSSIS